MPLEWLISLEAKRLKINSIQSETSNRNESDQVFNSGQYKTFNWNHSDLGLTQIEKVSNLTLCESSENQFDSIRNFEP